MLGATLVSEAPASSSRTDVLLGSFGAQARVRGRAMGTNCQIIVVAETPDLAVAAATEGWRTVVHLDQTWSRFRPDSQVSLLNELSRGADPGTIIESTLDGLTATLVAAMGWAYTYSGGIVDAAVLDAVIDAGYDEDFPAVVAKRGGQGVTGASTDVLGTTAPVSGASTTHTSGTGEASAPGAWGRRDAGMAEVSVAAGRVRRPAGVVLDPGGVGKGLAADLIVAAAPATVLGGVLVDLGGDIRVTGVDASGGPWQIGVSDERTYLPPLGSVADDAELTTRPLLGVWDLADGAMATSSTARRRWRGGHHLIDPRTKRPADTDLLAVTVVADSALAAEVCAKTALIRGRAFAQTWLAGRTRDWLLTTTSGTVLGRSQPAHNGSESSV